MDNQPIRVLQVVTYMGRGGLETMIMNYYRHVDRSKVQFDFLVHRFERADYDDEIEALGGTIYRLPRLVPWSRNYCGALNNFFEGHPEYHIVHVHQDCLSSIILKAAAHHNVPVRIAHSHNINQDRNFKYPVKLYYRRQITQYATHLFACGQEAGAWMFRGAPFQVLNNAIDTRMYQHNPERAIHVRKALGIPSDCFLVGHVGRFAPQKNHKFLLNIFAEIQKKKPDTLLLLIGDGSLHNEIEVQAQRLGLDRSVIFTGIRSDIPDLMQAMDVFVFPSLYEGLPVTMIEAQAAGLPCFISDKVPLDCKITDLVTQIPLQAPTDKWAEQILAARNPERKDTYNEIVAAGFDIVQNVKWLQNFYLKQWKDNE